jgi:hypothetical protein
MTTISTYMLFMQKTNDSYVAVVLLLITSVFFAIIQL